MALMQSALKAGKIIQDGLYTALQLTTYKGPYTTYTYKDHVLPSYTVHKA